VCETVFVSGADICGPGVRWGLYAQMALGLLVSLIPRVRSEVVISFGTSSLVTGIALLATGFVQGQREEIAYYQQAIVVQLAGMGFGPAALAWLKRGHARPDTVFFTFTILYTIVMGSFLFYTLGQEYTNGPIIKCYLDQVPKMYGKTAMKIVNAIIIGATVSIILFSMVINWHINKKYYHGSNDYSGRHPLNHWLGAFMVFVVFAAETVLAVLVHKTLTEYSSFVSADSKAALDAWQFGQIIPFMMLLEPIMEGLRAILPNIQATRNAAKQSRGEVLSETAVMRQDGRLVQAGGRTHGEEKTGVDQEIILVHTTQSVEFPQALV